MPLCACYPQYAVTKDGEETYLSASCAARAVADGSQLGRLVRDSDGQVRPITEEEKDEVLQLAEG